MKTISIAGALSLLLCAAANAETSSDRAIEQLRTIIAPQLRAAIIEMLRSTDLPRSERVTRTNNLIHGYADCVVSTLKVSRNPQAREFFNVLASRYPPGRVHDYFAVLSEDARLELLTVMSDPIGVCTRSVDLENGLLRDDKGYVSLLW